ncbi:Tachykinin-like peptides receptor 99D [Acropora cervicornis]|uniref:Tachykinin-like peptides receptor 99D n=1 Tax=Acropora cervicornis TaxID=6130 RepID=A0AAD9PTT1_ACRCE|nr:Tachykinin-like peptides receptor 99D [Acropora cervicornis]
MTAPLLPVYMDPVSEKAVIAVQSVIAVVALVGNSLVLVVFFASRFTLIHAYNHPDGKVGTILCKLLTGGTFGWIGSCASVFTMVAIAIERYYAVIISASWIFGSILCLPDFLVKDFCKSYRACVANWPSAHAWMPKAYGLLWTVLLTAIPVSVITVLYSRVILTLWGRSRVRKRVTTMVLVVSVIFAFCWITESTDYTLLMFFPKLALGNATHVISSTLIMFNSSINPIVYALISHRFRDEVIRMIRVTRTRIPKRPAIKISRENKSCYNPQNTKPNNF